VQHRPADSLPRALDRLVLQFLSGAHASSSESLRIRRIVLHPFSVLAPMNLCPARGFANSAADGEALQEPVLVERHALLVAIWSVLVGDKP